MNGWFAAKREFIIRGLSDDGVRVYLYPVEGAEPVATTLHGEVVYYRRE